VKVTACQTTGERLILFAMLRVQNEFDEAPTTVSDKHLGQQVGLIDSIADGRRFVEGHDQLVAAVDALVERGHLLRIEPQPMSGGGYRWRLAKLDTTLQQIAREILDQDMPGLEGALSADDQQMLLFAQYLGSIDDKIQLHDGEQFVGSCAKLAELGYIHDDVPYAIRYRYSPLRTTATGRAAAMVLRASRGERP
jgi:hypothetical protein